MEGAANLKVLFIAGFGPIVSDTAESRKLYRDVLGIPFKEEAGGYLHTEAVPGAKSFAPWLEFDVDSVEKATAVLESGGYRMLLKIKKEPWGQIVSRFISPEGILVGITFTPWMREQK